MLLKMPINNLQQPPFVARCARNDCCPNQHAKCDYWHYEHGVIGRDRPRWTPWHEDCFEDQLTYLTEEQWQHFKRVNLRTKERRTPVIMSAKPSEGSRSRSRSPPRGSRSRPIGAAWNSDSQSQLLKLSPFCSSDWTQKVFCQNAACCRCVSLLCLGRLGFGLGGPGS